MTTSFMKPTVADQYVNRLKTTDGGRACSILKEARRICDERLTHPSGVESILFSDDSRLLDSTTYGQFNSIRHLEGVEPGQRVRNENELIELIESKIARRISVDVHAPTDVYSV